MTTITPFPHLNKLFLLAAAFTGCALATAETYYVSPDGNDDDAGNGIRTAWRSISHAVSANSPVQAGDTIRVLQGEYIEQVKFQKSGKKNAFITLLAEGKVVVRDPDPSNGKTGVGHLEGVFEIEGQSNWTIDGFTIQDSWHFGIGLYSVSNITIQNCHTINTGASGIYAGRKDHEKYTIHNYNVNIFRCVIERPGQHGKKWDGAQESLSISVTDTFEVAYCHVLNTPRDGIDVKNGSRNGSVHHCIAQNIEKIGIYLDANNMPTYNIDIHNNLSINNFVGIAMTAELNAGLLRDVRVRNNTTIDNRYAGILFSYWGGGTRHETKDVIVENNVVLGSNRGIFAENADVSDTVITKNIIHSNLAGSEIEAIDGVEWSVLENLLLPEYRKEAPSR